LRSESILITGASGFIGSLLVRQFLRTGLEFQGLDVKPPQDRESEPLSYRILEADITRVETLPESIREAAVLIHCAALVHRRSSDLSPSNYFRVNYEGTRNILHALDASRLRRIIFLSTVSVYGFAKPGQTINERSLPTPVDPYGESKFAAEREIRSFSQERKIPYTIFRLAPVYSKGFHLNIDRRVYLPKHTAFFRIGDGSQLMSMCAVGNVIDAVTQSLEIGTGLDGVLNLKDREDYSINEIIAVMRKFNGHSYRAVLALPRSPFMSVTSRLSGQTPGRGGRFAYHLGKITSGATYSDEKLLRLGVRLPWSLSSEMLGEGYS
jgi:nucleoside-diphosphate-sugar epimerase